MFAPPKVNQELKKQEAAKEAAIKKFLTEHCNGQGKNKDALTNQLVLFGIGQLLQNGQNLSFYRKDLQKFLSEQSNTVVEYLSHQQKNKNQETKTQNRNSPQKPKPSSKQQPQQLQGIQNKEELSQPLEIQNNKYYLSQDQKFGNDNSVEQQRIETNPNQVFEASNPYYHPNPYIQQEKQLPKPQRPQILHQTSPNNPLADYQSSGYYESPEKPQSQHKQFSQQYPQQLQQQQLQQSYENTDEFMQQVLKQQNPQHSYGQGSEEQDNQRFYKSYQDSFGTQTLQQQSDMQNQTMNFSTDGLQLKKREQLYASPLSYPQRTVSSTNLKAQQTVKFDKRYKSPNSRGRKADIDGITPKITESPPPPIHLQMNIRKKSPDSRLLDDHQIKKALQSQFSDKEPWSTNFTKDYDNQLQRQIHHQYQEKNYQHKQQLQQQQQQQQQPYNFSQQQQGQRPQNISYTIPKKQFIYKSKPQQQQQQQNQQFYQQQVSQSMDSNRSKQSLQQKQQRQQNYMSYNPPKNQKKVQQKLPKYLKNVQSKIKDDVQQHKEMYKQHKQEQMEIQEQTEEEEDTEQNKMEEQEDDQQLLNQQHIEQDQDQEDEELKQERGYDEERIKNNINKNGNYQKQNEQYQRALENLTKQQADIVRRQNLIEMKQQQQYQQYQQQVDQQQQEQQMKSQSLMMQQQQQQQQQPQFNEEFSHDNSEKYNQQGRKKENILDIANSFLSSPIMKHFNRDLDEEEEEDQGEEYGDLHQQQHIHLQQQHQQQQQQLLLQQRSMPRGQMQNYIPQGMQQNPQFNQSNGNNEGVINVSDFEPKHSTVISTYERYNNDNNPQAPFQPYQSFSQYPQQLQQQQQQQQLYPNYDPYQSTENINQQQQQNPNSFSWVGVYNTDTQDKARYLSLIKQTKKFSNNNSPEKFEDDEEGYTPPKQEIEQFFPNLILQQ